MASLRRTLVLERADPAAAVAHDVVVVLAAGPLRLVAGRAVAHVEPRHEAQPCSSSSAR